MGIFIAVALVAAVLFFLSAVIPVFVAMIGGERPETSVLRRIAEAGQAKLAAARLGQEYRDLLTR